ncbi:MAG: phenylacetate-CoA oxygenase subunit PaaJ [Actinomycetota bacterium]|nr:phenylacetate-CoA oxygenase subunit PaaJ [Actinomycetota bacterium]
MSATATERVADTGGVQSAASGTDGLRDQIGAIPDPEIPVLTLGDLGILRCVETAPDGHVVVRITPTYSGCPAIDPIRREVQRIVRESGPPGAQVRVQLSPPWSTDWISDEGRRKLHEYGIAPPEASERTGMAVPEAPRHVGCALLSGPVCCPRCGSGDTREVSRFGATPCQAQHVCNSCLEPFGRFKTLR